MHDFLRSDMLTAFEDFYDKGWYVLGDQVKEFESEYANFSGTKYSVGVSNGLDALIIALRVLGVGVGDEVIVPSNTYIATLLAASNVGAVPVLVEPQIDTCNIDVKKIEQAITRKTKAIMPVHLYGQACAMDSILEIASKFGLFVIEDNAQAHGASWLGKLTGSWGHVNATSFYPGKNLGALGDAGAVTTNELAFAQKAMTLRNYGSNKKYFNEVIGYNNRLDEIQASFLRIKIKSIESWNEERRKIAALYDNGLAGIGDLILPMKDQSATHVYHLYVIRTNRRDALQNNLEKCGVGTLIHYPVPPHMQKAYQFLNFKEGDFPIAEELSKTSLSLPIWPGMKFQEIEFVISSIKRFYNSGVC
jgi:dTDP-4-amino-4,6-dideoxygalactose transaminase